MSGARDDLLGYVSFAILIVFTKSFGDLDMFKSFVSP